MNNEKVLPMSKYALMRMEECQNVILKEFWGLDSQALVHDAKFGCPNRLYHYTDIDSAIAILGGDDPCGFAFTHYRYLNDREEYDKGVDLALRWLYDYSRQFPNKDIVDNIMRRVEKKRDDQSCVPYVLSFTTEKDSTPQWMAYTDKAKGGYAIGVNFKRLQNAVAGLYKDEDPLMDLHYNEIMLAPCIYYSKLQAENVKAFVPVLECLFHGMEKAFYGEKMEEFSRWCAKAIFQFAAILKNENFSFEKEWRLVIRPGDAEYAHQLKFIGEKPRLQPSILPIRDFVDKIRISPQGKVKMLGLTAQMLGMKLGRKLKIKPSRSSYIGG